MPGCTPEAFDFYLSLGYKPIPARPRSKEPILKWGGRYRAHKARSVLCRWPNANIAVILGGPGGDSILDCEGDTRDANDLINDLCRGCEHPTFQSSKSTHHIFKNPDPHLTVLKHAGVEFRGSRHISVVPPSTHPTGVPYKWLTDPTMPAPEMPRPLAEWYWDRRPRGWGKKKDGKSSPWCDLCGHKHDVDSKRFKLELQAFAKHGQPWRCHGCREIDVRNICRFIKRHG